MTDSRTLEGAREQARAKTRFQQLIAMVNETRLQSRHLEADALAYLIREQIAAVGICPHGRRAADGEHCDGCTIEVCSCRSCEAARDLREETRHAATLRRPGETGGGATDV